MIIQSTATAAASSPSFAAAATIAVSSNEPTASGLLPSPPATTLPSPPQGYEPTTGSNFRGIAPWTAELVLLPHALEDLARFAATYTTLLGGTAPPIAQLVAALTVGGQWSTTRAASAAWDAWCRDHEGSAWRLINAMLGRLRPAFALAVRGDASIATTFPSLAEFLQIKKANTLKGVSTRRANKRAQADGKPATHGPAGKARLRRAAKAALAAAPAAASSPVPQAAAAAPPSTAAAPATLMTADP